LTTYTNDNIHSYTIYCDVSSPGSYRTVPGASLDECIKACDLDGVCTATTFRDGICSFCLPPVSLTYSPGSQCAVRPGSVQSSSTITTMSTTPTPSSTPAPCIDGEITTGAKGRRYRISCKPNTSWADEDLDNTYDFDEGNSTDCSTLCDARSPDCGAWVWAPEPGQAGGTCDLKLGPPRPVPGPDGQICGILIDDGRSSQVPLSPDSSNDSPGISVTSTSFEMAMTTTASSSSIPDTTTT
jgi:hypothetical protein